jgi:hypothetical protein
MAAISILALNVVSHRFEIDRDVDEVVIGKSESM